MLLCEEELPVPQMEIADPEADISRDGRSYWTSACEEPVGKQQSLGQCQLRESSLIQTIQKYCLGIFRLCFSCIWKDTAADWSWALCLLLKILQACSKTCCCSSSSAGHWGLMWGCQIPVIYSDNPRKYFCYFLPLFWKDYRPQCLFLNQLRPCWDWGNVAQWVAGAGGLTAPEALAPGTYTGPRLVCTLLSAKKLPPGCRTVAYPVFLTGPECWGGQHCPLPSSETVLLWAWSNHDFFFFPEKSNENKKKNHLQFHS